MENGKWLLSLLALNLKDHNMDIRTSTLIAGGLHACSPAWSLMSGQYADCHRLYFVRSGSAEFYYSETEGRDREGPAREGHAWQLKAHRVTCCPAMPGFTISAAARCRSIGCTSGRSRWNLMAFSRSGSWRELAGALLGAVEEDVHAHR